MGEIVEVILDGSRFPAVVVGVFKHTYGVQCLFYDNYYLIPHSFVSFINIEKHYYVPRD